MSGKLIVHCDGWEADESEVRNVPLPEETESYRPIPYGVVLDHANRVIREADMEIEARKFALSAGGNRFFAVFNLATNLLDLGVGGNLKLAMGIRTSLDKSIAPTFYGGSSVTLCDNMGAWSEIQCSVKQTTGGQGRIGDRFDEAFEKIAKGVTDWTEIVGKMRDLSIGRVDVNNILMETVREGLVPSSNVLKIVNEFERPTIAEWNGEDHNAWRLYNAFTQVAKGWSPQLQLARTRKISDVFTKRVGHAAVEVVTI